MSTQLLPKKSQRCHWYSMVSGPVPVQVPGSAVSTSPTSSVPEMVGATVLAGGAGRRALGALVAVSVPAAFVPVTTTTTVWPWSAAVSV